MNKNKILHDLKRIARAMSLLQDELDDLYTDIKNGDEEECDS